MPDEQVMTSPWITADDDDGQGEALLRPHGTETRYPAGATLFVQGEPSPGIFCLLEGSVKQSFLNGEGAERLLMVVGAGCIVGEVSTLDGSPSQTTVTALSGVKALFVDRQSMSRLIRQDPQVTLLLALALTRKLRASVKLVMDKSMRSVPDQMACLLHQLSLQAGPDRPGNRQVTLHLSHQELADSLGASRVAISQALAALKERGLVETGHRAIYVHDPTRLRCCGDVPFCVTRGPGPLLAGD